MGQFSFVGIYTGDRTVPLLFNLEKNRHQTGMGLELLGTIVPRAMSMRVRKYLYPHAGRKLTLPKGQYEPPHTIGSQSVSQKRGDDE